MRLQYTKKIAAESVASVKKTEAESDYKEFTHSDAIGKNL